MRVFDDIRNNSFSLLEYSFKKTNAVLQYMKLLEILEILKFCSFLPYYKVTWILFNLKYPSFGDILNANDFNLFCTDILLISNLRYWYFDEISNASKFKLFRTNGLKITNLRYRSYWAYLSLTFCGRMIKIWII